MLDPWLPLLGLALAWPALAVRRLRAPAAALLVLALMLFRPGYLPVVFVAQALPFLCLIPAGLADELWQSRTSLTTVSSLPAWLRRGVVIGVSATFIWMTLPTYGEGIRRAMNEDADRSFREAQAWLLANTDSNEWLLVDNSLWLDIVLAGRSSGQTVWYYKLDTDPGVAGPLGQGWIGFDYIVTTETMRTFTFDLPQVEAAIENSETVIVFGEDVHRIEVRRIQEL